MTKLNKIDENCDLFEQKNNIRTKMTKLNENLDQKGILTLILLFSLNLRHSSTLQFWIS